MSQIPAKDQGDLGICYAIVATQMFDAWRRVHPSSIDAALGTNSSSLYTAIHYALEPKNGNLKCPKIQDDGTPKFLFESGITCDAFSAIIKRGACSERLVDRFFVPLRDDPEIDSNLGAEVEEARDAVAQARARLAEDRLRLTQFNKAPLLMNPRQSEERRSAFRAAILKSELNLKAKETALRELESRSPVGDADIVRAAYKGKKLRSLCEKAKNCADCTRKGSESDPIVKGSIRNIDDKIEAVAKQTLTDFKRTIDKGACAKNGAIKIRDALKDCTPFCNHTERDETPLSEIQSLIESQLRQPKAVPVGIGICAASFKNEKQKLIWKKEDKNRPLPKDDIWLGHPRCGQHAVLVIGQRRNPETKKCQLVLKNSWGSDCEAVCANANCSCENGTGNIFIDNDLALKNIDDVYTISGKASCK